MKILILGALSAIGKAVAHGYAARGADLLLAGRNQENLAILARDLTIRHGGVHRFHRFDALDYASHGPFFAECLAIFPEVTHVVVCFGKMFSNAECFTDFAKTRETIEANYLGAVSILNLVAGHFAARGIGTIIGIASVAGDRGRSSNFIYGSAKAGLATYLEGLAHFLAPKGVHVLTVKPGFVDSPMTFGLNGLFLVASPDTVARKIIEAAARKSYVLYVPFFWEWILLIIKLLPRFIFHRTKL